MNHEEAAPETAAETAEQHEPTETPEVVAEAPAEPTTPALVAWVSQSGKFSAARAEHWHQDGKALLSQDSLRDWLTRAGLVLYTPRPQMGAPAPTLVEATLGAANATPALGETDAARTLVARLIADGVIVPLNLFGQTGGTGTDVPDFVVSAPVFSYIFTLRGNKAWKQSPVTSGPVKVSPLALATYELLSAKVTMSAYDLTTQLGKEVTETAVLRALTELWTQLRVLPVPQLDGSPTMWELSTSRFTKQIKAGANAGQPSALSALISLYLGQALGATEEEIESFLSPLAPRSRVRDVIHALLSARQLETFVVDGKTMLHVAGEAPAFATAAASEPYVAPAAGEDSGSRISSFKAKPGSKIGTGLRSKPAFGKPAFGADRERRPFKRDDRAGGRPSFDKPWQERAPRPVASGDGTDTPRSFTPRTEGFSPKPRFEGRREGFSGSSNAAGESRPPRRDFGPRPGGDGPRKTFSKPGTFGRKREGFGGSDRPSFGDSRPPRRDFGSQEGRPPRRDFADRGERPAGGGFKRPGSFTPRPRPEFGSKPSFGAPKPPFTPRDTGDQGSGEAPRKVFRKFDAPRDKKPFGAKPFGAKPFGAPRPPRTGESAGTFDRPRSGGFDRPKPSFGGSSRPSFGGSGRPSSGGSGRPSSGGSGRPSFGGGSRPSFGGGSDRPRPSFGGGGSDRPRPSFGGGSDRPRPDRPIGDRPSFGGGGGKPSFGAKKPFSKSSSFAKGGGPFAKFADGQKPFRKPGQPRPPRPAGGGFGPSKRRDS